VILGVAICAALLACTDGSQNNAGDTGVPATGVIVSIGPIPSVTLRAGESKTVIVRVVVGDGYHIQSNPASNEFLVPLELKFEPADGIQFGNPVYPKGRPYRLKGTDDDLMTYDGTVSVTVHVKASATASGGERLAKGSLSYQACDSHRCFFPKSVPVELKVAVSI
jgi:hypothetical protein